MELTVRRRVPARLLLLLGLQGFLPADRIFVADVYDHRVLVVRAHSRLVLVGVTRLLRWLASILAHQVGTLSLRLVDIPLESVSSRLGLLQGVSEGHR